MGVLSMVIVVQVVGITLFHRSSAKHDVVGDAMISFIIPYLLASPVMVVMHELAHAAAARLAGLRAPVIRIGTGHRLARLRVGTLWVDVHLPPTAGFCVFGPGPKPFRRWRLYLALAAGPGSHLLVILLMLAAAAAFDIPTLPFPLTNWFSALLTVNALFLLWSLLPKEVTIDGVKYFSDGKRLLHIWRSDDSDAAWLDAGLVNVVSLWIETNRVSEARRYLDLAKEKSPPSLSLVLAEVMTLAAEKNWAAAREGDGRARRDHGSGGPSDVRHLGSSGDDLCVAGARHGGDAADGIHAIVSVGPERASRVRHGLVRDAAGRAGTNVAQAVQVPHDELASPGGRGAPRGRAGQHEGNPAAERRWHRRAKVIDPTGVFMLTPPSLRNGD